MMKKFEKSQQRSIQVLNPTPNSREIDIVIHLLGWVIKIGRHFPIILLSMASLNVLMATNDFMSSSFDFAVLNSIFAISGFVSFIQMKQKSKTCQMTYQPSQNEPKGDLSQERKE